MLCCFHSLAGLQGAVLRCILDVVLLDVVGPAVSAIAIMVFPMHMVLRMLYD
jgi:hypothetical protein